MPRNAKGRFVSAATAKPADAEKGMLGSQTPKKAKSRSRTGKTAVGIRTVRCRIGNRIRLRPIPGAG